MIHKPLGIVIPTHNRSSVLMQCLTHLENQSFSDFEVIVVDDGSTDETQAQIQNYQSLTPLSIRYVKQENGGPAKARNTGISMLQSPICLMLGDDIFASPALTETHLQLHRQQEDLRVAALGLTRWSTRGQEVTPLMRWLEANLQFSYPLLLAGRVPDWTEFFTSNLSVKTELVRRFPFNEVFPFAAMEDMELAYRIKKQIGLDVKFIPDAVADHLHPTTFRKSCSRMIHVGYSTGIFHDLWPEQKPAPPSSFRQRAVEAIARRPRLLRILTWCFALLADWVDPNKMPAPYRFFFFSHYAVGLQSQVESARRGLLPEVITRPV